MENVIINQNALVNYKNYYIYADIIKDNVKKIIYVPEDLSINNIDDHINGIFNILKDGVETELVQNIKITVKWENAQCDLSIVDYWISLFMWEMILKTKQEIRPYHIFLGFESNNARFPWEIRRKAIQKYVNDYILTLDNKINIGNIELNKIIADGLWKFSYFDHFSYYLANTINNEDDIDLMNASKEFDDLIHCSLAGVPFENVKDEGMKITNRAIDIIKDSESLIGYEHGLTNSFRANEAINPRQYKEASLNIGTKPNGSGGIYPYIIDKNFKTGGVNDPLSYFIESSTARAAQIMSKINVGDSGYFARIIGLNNTDTVLNLNPDYECMSQHYIKYEIKSDKHLSMIKNRYFRFIPNGLDYLIDINDKSLIGKTVYLHSPMTCASHSSGKGICRRCYGNMYWVNNNINIGKIAGEILSAQLTQTLLSAKHLLETKIVSIQWNPEFKDFFDISINAIKLNDEILDSDNLKKYTLIINPDDIELVNEDEESITVEDEDGNEVTIDDDSGNYNEYITSFIIRTPDGSEIVCKSNDEHELYISQELNNIIRKKAYASEGNVHIPFSSLENNILFFIKIYNNEISKTMNDIINIVNKASSIDKMTKDEALQRFVDLIIEGNLTIDSIHLEVILSNQIVNPSDILKKPNWNDPKATHKMISLNQALTNNPSVIVSLLYKDLNRVLYNPLTFSKNRPSFFDLFFCEQPQNYMAEDILTNDTSHIRQYEDGIPMYHLTNNTDYKSKEEAFRKKLQDSLSLDE